MNIEVPSTEELENKKRALLKEAREKLCNAQNLCQVLGKDYKEIGAVVESVEKLLGITA